MTKASRTTLRKSRPDLVALLVNPEDADLAVHSSKVVLWRCPNHAESVPQRVSHRVNGIGCAVCANKRVLRGYNDMATTHPVLAAELVGDPSVVVAGTTRKLEWCCPRGHRYASSGNARVRGRGCPFCANKRVLPGYNDMATTRPDLAAELVGTDPTTVLAGTGKRLLWACPRHEQPYEASGEARVDGDGCGICKGLQIAVGYNDLATTHPELAAELIGTDPKTVVAFSHVKVLWRCPNHDEPYQASVANRANGRGCGYCRGFQVLPGYNDMATTHPELAAELQDADPKRVLAGARVRYSWKCRRCGHSWHAMGYQRSIGGSGCPKCAPRGYDPSQPAYIYLLDRHGEQQVGITSNLERRLRQHRAKGGWRLLDSIGPFDGQAAWETEFRVKLWLKASIGIVKGTTENWRTADLEVETVRDLLAAAGIDPPRRLN